MRELLLNPIEEDPITKREEKIGKINAQLRIYGLILAILLPIIFLFLAIYCFFRYTEEIKTNANETLISKQWTRHAKYKYRCYCELPHLFEIRMNSARIAVNKYLSQFYSKSLVIVNRCLLTICASLLAILIFLAVVNEENLIKKYFLARSLLWWCTGLGLLIGYLRQMAPPRYNVFDPWTPMKDLAEIIAIPESWIIYAHDLSIYREINSYFQPRGLLFLEEVLAILVLPYLMIFILPKQIERLVHFLLDNRVLAEDGEYNSLLSNLVLSDQETTNEKVLESRKRLQGQNEVRR